MKDTNIDEVSSYIFELTEDSIYNIIDMFEQNQNMDKSLTYIFTKAFYIHIAKICIEKQNLNLDFEKIYSEYRINLEIYYKSNNSQINQELLDEILSAFDNSFNLIESLEFTDIDNSYELRHHIIDSFELLRKILEKKSKSNIKTNIFENYISQFYNEAEKIINYIKIIR